MEEIKEYKTEDLLKSADSVLTSVRVSREFFDLCKDYNIRFSEAMRVGISLLLAERGLSDYDNRLNLYRKMVLYQKELEKSLLRIEELKGYLGTINKIKDNDEENDKVKNQTR